VRSVPGPWIRLPDARRSRSVQAGVSLCHNRRLCRRSPMGIRSARPPWTAA
jgi:hypothetical protein